MKKELNIDNVVEFLNSYGDCGIVQMQKDTLRKVDKLAMTILEYFYIHQTAISITNNNLILGSVIKLNDNYKDKLLYNVHKITFNKMYPNIISNLYEQGDIEFSIKEYGELYSFLVKNYTNIKTHNDMVEYSKQSLNWLLNTIFGLSVNNEYQGRKSFLLYHSNPNNVTEYSKETFNYIFEMFDNIVYIDTDTIYYVGDNSNFIGFLNLLYLPYTIDYDCNVWFFKLKKYIEEHNGVIKTHGIHKSKNNTYPYTTNVLENFKKIVRLKKVKSLLK